MPCLLCALICWKYIPFFLISTHNERDWTFKVLELLNTMGTFKVGLNTFYNIVMSLWGQGVDGYGLKLIQIVIKSTRGGIARVDIVTLTDSRFIWEGSLNEGSLGWAG